MSTLSSPGQLEGSRSSALAALTLVTLFFVAVTLLWFRLHTAPPSWDESNYLETSELLFQSIKAHSWRLFSQAYVGAVFGSKAPLIAVLAIPAYLIVGHGTWAFNVTMTALVGVLCVTTYLMGVTLTRNRWIGVGAVLFTGTMPIAYGLSHVFLVDYTLMIFATAWVWLQVRSDGYRRLPYVVGLGATLGLGTLTKVSFPVFVAGPAVWGLVLVWRREGVTIPVVWRLVRAWALILLSAGAIAATWYLPESNYRAAIAHAITASSSTEYATYGASTTLTGLLHFGQDAIVDGLSVYHGLLFLTLGVACVLRRLLAPASRLAGAPHEPGAALVVSVWPLMLFAAACTAVVKDTRYLIPIFPFLGVALAWLLTATLRGLRPARVLGPAAFIVPVIVMMLNSLPLGDNVALAIGRWRIFGPFMGFAGRPVNEAWPQQSIVRAIARDASAYYAGRVPLAVLLSNTEYFNQHNFRYYGTALGLNAAITWSVVISTSDMTEADLRRRLDWMQQAKYIVTKTGDQGPSFTSYHSLDILKMLQRGDLPYEPWLTMSLPDGSEGVVYRHRPGNFTRVIRGHAIDRRSAIVSWQASVRGPDVLRLKVWRQFPDGFALVGESRPFDAHPGANSFVLDVPIDVLSGDHIGVYTTSGEIQSISRPTLAADDLGQSVAEGDVQWVPTEAIPAVAEDLSLSVQLDDAAIHTTTAEALIATGPASTLSFVDYSKALPAPVTITSWLVSVMAPEHLRLIVWRHVGSEWQVVGESGVEAAQVGVNRFMLSAPLQALAGDFLGFSTTWHSYDLHGLVEPFPVRAGTCDGGANGSGYVAGQPPAHLTNRGLVPDIHCFQIRVF